MVDLLIEDTTIITMDPQRRVLTNSTVAIDGNRITAIGPTERLRKQFDANHVIHAKGKVVLPGLIDSHGHAGHGLLRTLGTDTDGGWVNACEEIYSRGSTEDFWRVDAYLMVLERLKFGVTCGVTLLGGGGAVLTGDMIMRTDSPVYGARHCEAVQAVGAREFLAIGPRRSPFPHHYVRRNDDGREDVMIGLDDYLETCEALITDWHGKADGKINIAMMTQTHHPDLTNLGTERHSELLKETRVFYELAEQHGLLFTQDGHTTGTIAFAHNELGILGPRTLLSHSTDLTEEDIAVCEVTDTRIVHNPSAIASITGRCPVPELIDAGVTVVLGSDGLGPDRSCDMFRNMFLCMRYHRRHFKDPSYLPAGKVLEMVTVDAAKALGVEQELGSLEPGKKADLIIIDTGKPHLTPLLMPVHQVINFANGNDVETVIVDGKILIEAGEVKSVNESEILALVQEIAEETIDHTQLHALLDPGEKFWGHSRT